MQKRKDSLDSIFDNMDDVFSESSDPVDTKPVTFWLPIEYKLKFESLQGRTNRKFGKKLQELLKKSIDKFDYEAI